MTERYQSEVINRREFSTESHGLLTIQCAADTLNTVTVEFGRSFTIRFNVTDVQDLVSMLEDAQEAAGSMRTRCDYEVNDIAGC